MTTARAAATARAVAAAASESPVGPGTLFFAYTSDFFLFGTIKENKAPPAGESGRATWVGAGIAGMTLEACRVRWYLLRGSVTHDAVRDPSKHRAVD